MLGSLTRDVKLGYLVAEQVELENAMAWLSTLGGAYSALGDNNVKFVSKTSLADLIRCRFFFLPSVALQAVGHVAMSHDH